MCSACEIEPDGTLNWGDPRGGMPLLVFALIVAAIAWFFLFAVPGTPFWVVIASATFVLGGSALIIYPGTLQISLKDWLKLAIIGVIGALFLYFIFWVGNYIVRLLPFGGDQVANVYATKTQASNGTIAALLLFPIGPGEELFWRAWVQRALMNRFGTWKGFGYATALYTLVHAPSLNLTLLLAALVAGLFWGVMYIHYKNIWPGVVSHAFWDALIFVWAPLN